MPYECWLIHTHECVYWSNNSNTLFETLEGRPNWTRWCLVTSSQSWPHASPPMSSARRSSPTATCSPSAEESNRLILSRRTETANQGPRTTQKARPLCEAPPPCLPLNHWSEVMWECDIWLILRHHYIVMNGDSVHCTDRLVGEMRRSDQSDTPDVPQCLKVLHLSVCVITT